MNRPHIQYDTEVTITVSFQDDDDPNSKRYYGRKLHKVQDLSNIMQELGEEAHDMLAKLYGKYGKKDV